MGSRFSYLQKKKKKQKILNYPRPVNSFAWEYVILMFQHLLFLSPLFFFFCFFFLFISILRLYNNSHPLSISCTHFLQTFHQWQPFHINTNLFFLTQSFKPTIPSKWVAFWMNQISISIVSLNSSLKNKNKNNPFTVFPSFVNGALNLLVWSRNPIAVSRRS